MDKSPGGGSPADLVQEQVSQGAQQVQQTAGQVAQAATQQAQSFVGDKKNEVAGSLQTVAQTLRHSGQDLQQNGQGMAANVIDTMATRVDSLAGYLQNESIDQIVGDVENFARGNTWAFLGGAFVLGVAAARFLKSSTPPPPMQGYSGSRGYGGYGSYGGYAGGTYPNTYPYGTGEAGSYITAPYRTTDSYSTQPYPATQPEGQYNGQGTGRMDDTSGTPDVQVNYASGMMEGDDGTTR